MRFLFFATSNFKPESGGVAELGHQLAASLIEKGHEVTVIAGKLSPGELDVNYPYRVVRTGHHQPYKLAEALTAEIKPDALFVLIIASSWKTAYKVSKKYGIPLTLYVHGIEITKKNNIYPIFKVKQFVKTIFLIKSDFIFCNSQFTANLVKGRGVKMNRIRVLNPGILINISHEGGGLSEIAPGKIVFFTMGRLVKRKGVDFTIRAIALLIADYPDILYVIAGEGENAYREELAGLVRSLGLENNVLFLGGIDEQTKQMWYRRQDVFIMPSRELRDGDVEGFGIVFLEAASWSKPVIGGFSGGIPDAVENGKSGLLPESDSVESIAAAMRYFIENPDKRAEMGKYGYSRIKEQFTWSSQTDKFIDFIQIHIKNTISGKDI
jgi:phosphatidylinositol alpha-1,6-mannosyltransferase